MGDACTWLPRTRRPVLVSAVVAAVGGAATAPPPAQAAPPLSVPTVTTPRVAVVPLSTPGVTAVVPTGADGSGVPVSVPPVTTPGVTVPPSTSVPAADAPSISVPSASSPDVAVPSIETPSVEVPGATVPPVATPSIDVPPVATPSIDVPPVRTPRVGRTDAAAGGARNGSGRTGPARTGAASGSGRTNAAAGAARPGAAGAPGRPDTGRGPAAAEAAPTDGAAGPAPAPAPAGSALPPTADAAPAAGSVPPRTQHRAGSSATRTASTSSTTPRAVRAVLDRNATCVPALPERARSLLRQRAGSAAHQPRTLDQLARGLRTTRAGARAQIRLATWQLEALARDGTCTAGTAAAAATATAGPIDPSAPPQLDDGTTDATAGEDVAIGGGSGSRPSGGGVERTWTIRDEVTTQTTAAPLADFVARHQAPLWILASGVLAIVACLLLMGREIRATLGRP